MVEVGERPAHKDVGGIVISPASLRTDCCLAGACKAGVMFKNDAPKNNRDMPSPGCLWEKH